LRGKSISAIFIAGLAVTSCSTANEPDALDAKAAPKAKTVAAAAPGKITYNYTAKDRDCLKRAMYFESEHSDRDGYMAVGTVVMNRLTSQAYSDSICGVVGQKKQFAPGVLTRTVEPVAEPQLDAAADDILRGARHPGVKEAMFFHTEGLKFPYGNMHYVTAAGGNVFYEKRGRDGELQTPAPMPSYEVAMNYVAGDQRSGSVQFAGVEQYNAAPQPAPATPAVGTAAAFDTGRLYAGRRCRPGWTRAVRNPAAGNRTHPGRHARRTCSRCLRAGRDGFAATDTADGAAIPDTAGTPDPARTAAAAGRRHDHRSTGARRPSDPASGVQQRLAQSGSAAVWRLM